MKNLIYAFILIVIVSCNATHEATKTQTRADVFMQNSSHTKSYRTTEYDKISSLDKSKPNGQHLEPPSAAFNQFKFDNKWTEAHSMVLSYFAKNEKYSLYFQEQMIACVMLDEYLLEEANTKEVNEATSFYTALLIKNESSEVLLMTKALKKLERYWEKTKLATVKAQVRLISENLLTTSDISATEKEQIKKNILK